MNIYLMNSAMMPTDGHYTKETLTPQEWAKRVKMVNSMIQSRVGYPNCQRVIEGLTEIRFELSREPAVFEPGDMTFCVQLQYRMQKPGEKRDNSHGQKVEDYIFSIVNFS